MICGARQRETTRLSFLCRCFEDQASDHAGPLIDDFVVARPLSYIHSQAVKARFNAPGSDLDIEPRFASYHNLSGVF